MNQCTLIHSSITIINVIVLLKSVTLSRCVGGAVGVRVRVEYVIQVQHRGKRVEGVGLLQCTHRNSSGQCPQYLVVVDLTLVIGYVVLG